VLTPMMRHPCIGARSECCIAETQWAKEITMSQAPQEGKGSETPAEVFDQLFQLVVISVGTSGVQVQAVGSPR
jgi:hypothetical protein